MAWFLGMYGTLSRRQRDANESGGLSTHRQQRYHRPVAMITPDAEIERVELGPATALFRSLGDPARLMIVRRLAAGPARVTDLTAGLGLAQSTVSKHLACLRDCGLVASEPSGRASVFRLAQAHSRVINGQRIPLRGWVALVLGLAGIAVLARPSGNGAMFPVLVVLGASVSWGVGSVLAGLLPAPASPLVGSAMEMLTGGIVLTGLAAATGELTRIDPAHVSVPSLLGLLYLIGPGSLLALTCYVIALRRLPTAAVSTYAYVNPVVAVSLGALFLSERPTPATLLGGVVALVSVAMLLIHRTENPPGARAQRGAGRRLPVSWGRSRPTRSR